MFADTGAVCYTFIIHTGGGKELMSTVYYLTRPKLKKSIQCAGEWLLERAEGGDLDAQFMLGEYYLYEANDADFHEAFRWFLKAAKHGNEKAQYRAGELYLQGKETGDAWIRKAAEMGFAVAQNDLGQICEKKRDDREAAKWYRKAAEQGCKMAKDNLERMYRQGRGFETNDSKAINWYRKVQWRDMNWV